MGEKSLQKKNMIVEAARGVFLQRGYKAVTMKDIVEACGISRGGLYLYFSNTKELFEAVLEKEAGALSDGGSAISEAESPGEAMLMYLDEQKREILRDKGSLTVATCEYLFENGLSASDNPAGERFEENVRLLCGLIEDGVAQDWMVCESPERAARNILYALEGMKLTARTIGVSEKDMDGQIEYIMGILGMVIK